MDSYTSLLERTRVSQPSLQKLAVSSIFSKLRSAPAHIGPESDPGSDAISQCLRSSSPAVVDQSVRELCRLVLDSKLEVSAGLLELQSALEGSEPRFVGLFVKGLGFLVRLGFKRSGGSWRVGSHEHHPFVKVLASRTESHSELVQQVLLLMAQKEPGGMEEICDFLRPFMSYSILQIPFSIPLSSLFVKDLVKSIASFTCVFPSEALPIFKLLISCLHYFPRKNVEETRNFLYTVECMVDSITVVLRQLVEINSLLITEAQICAVKLLKAVFSRFTSHREQLAEMEPTLELLKRLVDVQRDLSLQYVPELSSLMISLSVVLIWVDLEHEQFSILKFLHLILTWKTESDSAGGRHLHSLSEELLAVFLTINVMSASSKSVKGVATDLLFILEKPLMKLVAAQKMKPSKVSARSCDGRLESVISRLLQYLWFQERNSLPFSSFLNVASGHVTDLEDMHSGSKSWPHQIRDYYLLVAEKRRTSLLILKSQEFIKTGIPLLLGALSAVLVMHSSVGSDAVDSLAATGILDPKLGVSLLLLVLFYSNVFIQKDLGCQDMLLRLFEMLPLLASQSSMVPFVVQTILPMLQKDVNPVLYSTATRLLCQTWENNDRAFDSLQGLLSPKKFDDFASQRHICLSMAASLRDVCKKDPDRGVDLILSVSACIEGQDLMVRALGFQSLSYLCEADVIDFYTAWDVIAKHMQDCHVDPFLANSVCLLLRCGAMDADVYPEASKNVLTILWSLCSTVGQGHELEWAKAGASALKALTQYEVQSIEKAIPNFKQKSMEVLLLETNPDVLEALEGLHVKIIAHEHKTRRRFVKEKKVPANKIEKLLDVLPQTIFLSGRKGNTQVLPGAALLCRSITPKEMSNQGVSKGLQVVHSVYRDEVMQIGASLQLSRNILVALLSLQSWKAFMHRWLRDTIVAMDANFPKTASDKTLNGAGDILKELMQVAEEAIPRSAENIALAIGALSEILPPSAHSVKSTASKYLLSWLFQYEHEYRQWSAAISLGFMSSSLHVTDHKQKLHNITALLKSEGNAAGIRFSLIQRKRDLDMIYESVNSLISTWKFALRNRIHIPYLALDWRILKVLCSSKSTLVKGACAVGLGFSCQHLLSQVESTNNSDMDNDTYRMQEVRLLGQIVRSISLVLSPMTCPLAPILDNLSAQFSAGTDDLGIISTPEGSDNLEDDLWGVAGLVLGLGSCVGAIYRAGEHESVRKVKHLLTSSIPHVSSSFPISGSSSGRSYILLSVGSCLVLPLVATFLQRVEMMDGNELDNIVNGFKELISELLSVNKSGPLHKNLLMAATTGAGNLIGCILNESIHLVEHEAVNCLLELFRMCYSGPVPFPPIIHLSGMLGVVNVFGAGAGNLVNFRSPTSSGHKESSHILCPLLASPVFEEYALTLIQEIFQIAQSSDDHKMQQCAAWAASFLRHQLWSQKFNTNSLTHTEFIGSNSVSQGVSEDSVVMKLCLWLENLNYSQTGVSVQVCTVVAVLKCLSQAPRLPRLEWGAIIRRCMRFEGHVAESLGKNLDHNKGALREECLRFAFAHAKQSEALVTLLDELFDLSRFQMLEPTLQSCLLIHLSDLIELFSGSRIEKLFDDVAKYLSSIISNQSYNSEQQISLRIACWRGLYQCLDEASLDSQKCISRMQKCMEVLFMLLPDLQLANVTQTDSLVSVKEWLEAASCLGKAPRDWLLELLQVSHCDHVLQLKKIQMKAKLVCNGPLTLSDLSRLKALLLNSEPVGTWNVLIEVVAALQQAEGVVKRQWLLDAAEISCVTSYPSTALQFIGLISGSCCKYMPLLILDRACVLNDLPVTLSSLLTDPRWEVVAETFVSVLFTSTERIYSWASQIIAGDNVQHVQYSIDESENKAADFLLQVIYRSCLLLKDYLPLEKQLRLANMVVDSDN